MKNNASVVSTTRGFSLVELMVAILIGLIISIGVVQIFGATRATYQLDESLARAQENGRFAIEFLQQDIRHAGYAGCKRDTSVSVFNNLSVSTAAGLFITGISGAEFTGSPTGFGDTYTLAASPGNTTSGWSPALTAVPGLPSAVSAVDVAGALPGSDVLAIQRMAPNSWALVPPYVDPENVFLHPDFVNRVRVGMSNGDVLLVADCRSAVAFRATAITPTGIISHDVGPTANRCARWTGGLDTTNAASAACAAAFDYTPVPATTAIGKLETVVFYVANDPTADAANPRPTLFRRVILATGDVVENAALVEGVENFQVLYGVDNVPSFDGVADSYVPANAVADFARVVSVQIGVLVYGVNATGTANDTSFDTDIHDVGGTSIVPAPNSTRKRRVFNTTIQLRNRSF